MAEKNFFFAGGGTAGHIYPAIAVAEQLIKLNPNASIHFFCSSRQIDKRVFSKTNFNFTPLPAKGFSLRPAKIADFTKSFIRSYRIAKRKIAESSNPVLIGAGGFVAAPACLAAVRCRVPVKLINIDAVPGKANRLLARFADEIFLQFEDTKEYFKKSKAKLSVTGCPLRAEFENPNPDRVIEELGLEKQKKVLLITGASSGAESINRIIVILLDKLNAFAEDWQIVHLTGADNLEKVKEGYERAEISHRLLGYFDDMAPLLSAADLVIGRSGAVSVAEYAAAGLPAVCMPYPHHKDRQQYRNAGKLVEAGAAIIVDDLPDENQTAQWLAEELLPLLKAPAKLKQMADGCKMIAGKDAALKIAQNLFLK